MTTNEKRKHKYGAVIKFASTEMEIMRNEIKFYTGRYISHPITFGLLEKICSDAKDKGNTS